MLLKRHRLSSPKKFGKLWSTTMLTGTIPNFKGDPEYGCFLLEILDKHQSPWLFNIGPPNGLVFLAVVYIIRQQTSERER
jgi:hypothetical protein